MSCNLAQSKARTPRRRGRAHKETVASDVPASVPHFKTFDHIADPRVRRAKEYEQYLQFLLDRFPEFGSRIKTEIEWARAEADRSKASDRERICALLEKWDSMFCEEIAEDLALPYPTVYKLLRALLDEGLVTATTREGRSGNRPKIAWALPHDKL